MSEHNEQAEVYAYVNYHINRVPELALLHAIPNVQKAGGPALGRHLVKEGLRRGMLDNNLPVARHGYNSFWCEMKYGKNQMSAEQKDKAELLAKAGNLVLCCWSANQMITELWLYMGLEWDSMDEPERGKRWWDGCLHDLELPAVDFWVKGAN